MAKKSAASGTGRQVTKAEARAAAKVKVTVDKRLGKTTPKWIRSLAEDRSA